MDQMESAILKSSSKGMNLDGRVMVELNEFEIIKNLIQLLELTLLF